MLCDTRAGMSGRERSGKFGHFGQEREYKPSGPTLMVMCLPSESGHKRKPARQIDLIGPMQLIFIFWPKKNSFNEDISIRTYFNLR